MFGSLLARPSADNTWHGLRARLAFLGLLCLFLAVNCSQAAAQVTIFQDDFEGGTTTGWYAFGGPTLTNVSDVFHGGAHSLLTTGRTQSWEGPAHDLSLTPGSTYHISAWVRVTDAEAGNGDKVTMTVKRTDATDSSCTNGTCYDTVGPYQAAVTNTWLELSGDYTVSTTATALTLYFQLANTDSFYVDDVLITSSTLPPPTGCAAQDNSGFNINFDDGNLDGWSGRAATVTNVAGIAHSGANSILVSGRTANWNGAQIGVDNKMCVGSNYAISGWVLLQPNDGSNHVINISLQTTYGSNTNYSSVSSYPGVTVPADGQWHQIKVPNYSVGSNYDTGQAFLYFQTNMPSGQSGDDLVSFYIDDFQLSYLPPLQIEQNIASIYQHYQDYFPIGTAVIPSDMAGAHAQLLAKHFNSITSGNDMKWDATERTENTFTYTNADTEVTFAQANNMAVRGHTLLWHQQTPDWVFLRTDGSTPLDPATPADVDLLKSRLQNHIHNLMQHFGNKVWAWDVVNEVIDESQSDCLRRSNWYKILGPSYIDLAFQYARDESATAKLFINDYNTTTDPKKTCLYNLVQGMITRGVPVDGVGHQMHANLWYPPVQSLTDTVNQFHGLTTVADKPLDQQITELDISIYPYPVVNPYDDYALIPADLFVQQGYLYRDFFAAMKQLNSDSDEKKISSVTIWGMSDDETWLTKSGQVDGPLPFDIALQHKPAYTGIMSPLDLPGADLAITISAVPSTVVSGETVTYTITVTNRGPDQASALTLTDVLPAGLTLQSHTDPGSWTCTSAEGTVSCTAATLDNGASAQIELVATATGAGPIVNTVNISATSRDPNPTNDTASASIQVTTPPAGDFSVDTPAAATAWAPPGGTATRTLTVHSLNGYAGTVTVSCTTGWGGACTGQQVALAADGEATATLSIVVASGTTLGNSTLSVTVQDGSVSHGNSFAFAIADVTGSVTPATLSMSAGGSGSTTVNLTGSTGFNSSVQLACDAPAGVSCAFTPASVSLNSSSASSSLVISASASASLSQPGSNLSALWATALGIPFFFVLGGRSRKRLMALLVIAIAGVLMLGGCGSDKPPVHPKAPNTYTVNVTASVPQTTVTKTIGTVTVTVNH